MQWRALSIEPRDVTLANGETLRTVASFQGADGDRDILKAHVCLDAGDLALVTEFESADGKRQFGRTTQWPAEIVVHLGGMDMFRPRMEIEEPAPSTEDETQSKAIMDSLTPDEIAEAGSASLAYMRKKIALKTEINPESEAQGGSGDPAAPAGPVVIEPKGEPPANPPETDHALARQEMMARASEDVRSVSGIDDVSLGAASKDDDEILF
jgi:hypothetical protein